MRRLVILMVVVNCWNAIGAKALDLYVAVDGSDSRSGRSPENGPGNAGPFATLERARDEIRRLKEQQSLPAGPVTVQVRGGIYPLKSTFELTSADSGTAENPITWQARAGECPRLIGGREVLTWSTVTDDAVRRRLDAAARDRVRQADLKSLGITDFGTVEPGGNRFELFHADRPMPLSRWPNEGYTKVGQLVGGKPVSSHGHRGDAIGKFGYEGDRPLRWTAEKEIWLSGYWFWDWADAFQPLESVDTEKRVLSIRPPYHHYGYRQGQRYVAMNLLSEIDSPGEWFLDRPTGTLYFWPPADANAVASGPDGGAAAAPPEARTFVSVLQGLVVFKDAAHLVLRGLTFEFNRGTAVAIQGGTRIQVARCTLHNVGGQAVAIRGGTRHAVVGCDIYDTGDGGVHVDGGDRMKLIPGGHLVLNNHFYRYSRNSRTYRPAVSVHGMGHRVAHNLIHDAPHMAIQFAGNEHVIEFNEIYRVCTETDDAGAIYTGRDWTWRGNRIQFNYFHHMGDYKTWVGVMSVYLDDWASASTVYGNVFYKAGRAVLVGGGRNNTIENNIFVDCSPAVHIDSRGLGWAKPFLDDPDNTMFKALRATPYKEPPWSTRYPELVTVLDDEPALAKYNVVARNIRVGGKWLDLLDRLTDRIVRVEHNLVDQDPRFVDAARQDFRLREDSPAFGLGFKQIPMEKIGLYRDELRASWPPPPRPQ
jgi:hypothetical protein